MKDLSKQIHNLLLKSKKTISVAESCTGGLLSKTLTDISGSSKYFILGIVAYNNRIKTSILKISPALINKNGAVSAEVAEKMSQSVMRLGKTDYGIGITGIAGPTGGTATKPIGTVYIAVSNKNKIFSKRFNFTGSRDAIRKKATLASLKLLLTGDCVAGAQPRGTLVSTAGWRSRQDPQLLTK